MRNHSLWGPLVRPAVSVVGLVLLVAACDVRVGDDGVSLGIVEGRASDEWSRSYELSSGGVVEIGGVNGTIQAAPADDGRVAVLARRRARARSDEAAQALLDAFAVHEEVSAERVAVSVRREDGRAGTGFGGPGISVEYEVRLPPGVRASFTTENGNVELDELDGQVVVSTTNGRIIGRALSGPLEAHLVNGGIDVDFARVTGEVRMTTVNGGIRVTVAPDVTATVEASAVNGGVSVDDELPFDADTSDRRRLTGRLNGGGPMIVLQTTNGAVRVARHE